MSTFKFSPTALCFAAVALGVLSTHSIAEASPNFGAIAFVGDSITQGGGTAQELSYRYSLWKCFVDANVPWNTVGSTTIFRNGASASESLTPSYGGVAFDEKANRNEGHYGWRTSWVLNGPSGAQPNSGSGNLSEWLANPDYYPSGHADTVTLMLGVNDLSDGTEINTIADNARQIVQAYQTANPNTNVYVFSILPSAQASWAKVPGKIPREVISQYNDVVKAQIEAGSWDSGNSKVTYSDVTAGFDPVAHTSDLLHPNAQGALIVSGNIARALGIEQRSAGLERRGGESLSTQTTFEKTETSWSATAKFKDEEAKNFSYNKDKNAVEAEHVWTVSNDGHLKISTGKAGGSDIRLDWASGTAQDFTFDVSVKMDDTSRTDNFLGIFLGNGSDSVGVLYIGESGIFWGNTANSALLYGEVSENYKTDFAATEYIDLRVAYVSASEKTEAGYYVWLGDVLIGDCLSGNTTLSQYTNSLLIGDIGSSYAVNAEIASLSFERGSAYSPIPEPSAFGLLAGIGALALVASRRRRK